MSIFDSISLLVNGLTLALALGFLLIVLWQDTSKPVNQFFAVFLLLVTLWNGGTVLAQTIAFVSPNSTLLRFSINMLELGFIGSCIAIYALTAVLVGIQMRYFRVLVFVGLVIVFGFQLALLRTNANYLLSATIGEGLSYRFQSSSIAFYVIFDGATLYLLWRYRRKMRSQGLKIGIVLFVIGQSVAFLNPELRTLPLSINISSVAALLTSFSLLRQEIIDPLADRVAQVEALHSVSLAITSHISINTVLDEMAKQAANWLNAEAAGIFLTNPELNNLELAAVHQLPHQYMYIQVPQGEGVISEVASTQKSKLVENYRRAENPLVALPLAQETFGSVVCVPLIYGDYTIGVLMVIAGKQGRVFTPDDTRLLELLGAQAAVAIAHSRLFQDVESARSQLETVLTSTENPVIAISTTYRVIFANSAARELFSITDFLVQSTADEVVPNSYHKIFEAVAQDRPTVFEYSQGDRVYMCNVAPLQTTRLSGWVAVLNDVTELKELDRVKSEMIRMASHDLKNPLQIAMANLELLAEDLEQMETDEEMQLSVTEINRQLDRMNRIIGGVLDLERIRSDSYASELCNPVDAVEKVIDDMRQMARDSNIALITEIADDLPYFAGNQKQFEHALVNLVENAIKFTPGGGRITVAVRPEGETIVFKITDTGIGIPEDIQERVFDRFFRGRQKGVEHVSGSGLGLSFVKTIVENHRGEILLESKEGEGTSFLIQLPNERAADQHKTDQDKEAFTYDSNQ